MGLIMEWIIIFLSISVFRSIGVFEIWFLTASRCAFQTGAANNSAKTPHFVNTQRYVKFLLIVALKRCKLIP